MMMEDWKLKTENELIWDTQRKLLKIGNRKIEGLVSGNSKIVKINSLGNTNKSLKVDNGKMKMVNGILNNWKWNCLGNTKETIEKWKIEKSKNGKVENRTFEKRICLVNTKETIESGQLETEELKKRKIEMEK